MGLALAILEGPAAGAARLREAFAQRSDPPAGRLGYWSEHLAPAAAMLWDNDLLRRVATDSAESTRKMGALTLLPAALNMLANSLALDGRLDEASALVVEATGIAGAVGHPIEGWPAEASIA